MKVAARKKIQGITIELNGESKKLQDALSGVDKKLKDTQDSLRDVGRLLKIDPGNTELLAQKQQLLADAVKDTEDRLKALKEVSEQAGEALANGNEDQRQQYDALQREIIETEQQLKSLTQQAKDFGSVSAQQIAAAGEKVKALGDKIGKAGTAMSKYVTAPIVAVGAASVAAFSEVDEGLDIVVKKTGATGAALEDLQARAKNLATSIPTDFATAGTAVGEVNTRFGLTGDALEALAGKFVKFAELNDTDVSTSVDNVQAAMAAYNVRAERAGDVLDMLNKAAQETGTDVNKLASDLTANAAALQEMGFGINNSIGFLARLNKSGLDASTVLTGMKKALQNATKQGIPMAQALDRLQKSIAGAKSETEAMQAATELFGAKAAPALVKAMREGRLSFDDMANAVMGFGDSVDSTFDATQDPIDGFKTSLNELKIVGLELVEAAAPMIRELAAVIKRAVESIRQAWGGLSPFAQQTIIKLAAIAAVIGPVLVVIGKVTSAVGGLMQLAPKLVGLISQLMAFLPQLGGLIQGLWAAIAAHPIAAIIAAITAVVAAIIHFWNTSEGFRDFCTSLGQTLLNIAVKACNGIKNVITKIVETVKTFAGNLWESVTGTVSRIWESVTGIFTRIKDAAFNWGRDMIQNFIDGITRMWEALKRKVSDVAGMIGRFLGFSEPEEGALSNFHTYAPDMMKLFAQGVQDNAHLITEAINKAFDIEPLIPKPDPKGGGQTIAVPKDGGRARPINIIFEIDGAQRYIYTANKAETQRVGVKLAEVR